MGWGGDEGRRAGRIKGAGKLHGAWEGVNGGAGRWGCVCVRLFCYRKARKGLLWEGDGG